MSVSLMASVWMRAANEEGTLQWPYPQSQCAHGLTARDPQTRSGRAGQAAHNLACVYCCCENLMNSLAPGFIERQPIPQNLVRTIRVLGEFKGKEEMFQQQSPQ